MNRGVLVGSIFQIEKRKREIFNPFLCLSPLTLSGKHPCFIKSGCDCCFCSFLSMTRVLVLYFDKQHTKRPLFPYHSFFNFIKFHSSIHRFKPKNLPHYPPQRDTDSDMRLISTLLPNYATNKEVNRT